MRCWRYFRSGPATVRLPIGRSHPSGAPLQAARQIAEGHHRRGARITSVEDLVDGVWQGGRIVLGGVAPIPFRATGVEEVLAGREIRSALPDALGEVRKIARPMRDNAYKLELVEYLLERVVLAALESDPVAAPTDAGRSDR